MGNFICQQDGGQGTMHSNALQPTHGRASIKKAGGSASKCENLQAQRRNSRQQALGANMPIGSPTGRLYGANNFGYHQFSAKYSDARQKQLFTGNRPLSRQRSASLDTLSNTSAADLLALAAQQQNQKLRQQPQGRLNQKTAQMYKKPRNQFGQSPRNSTNAFRELSDQMRLQEQQKNQMSLGLQRSRSMSDFNKMSGYYERTTQKNQSYQLQQNCESGGTGMAPDFYHGENHYDYSQNEFQQFFQDQDQYQPQRSNAEVKSLGQICREHPRNKQHCKKRSKNQNQTGDSSQHSSSQHNNCPKCQIVKRQNTQQNNRQQLNHYSESSKQDSSIECQFLPIQNPRQQNYHNKKRHVAKKDKKSQFFSSSNNSASQQANSKHQKSLAQYTLGAPISSDCSSGVLCASNLPWNRFRQYNSSSAHKNSSQHTFYDHEADVRSFADHEAHCLGGKAYQVKHKKKNTNQQGQNKHQKTSKNNQRRLKHKCGFSDSECDLQDDNSLLQDNGEEEYYENEEYHSQDNNSDSQKRYPELFSGDNDFQFSGENSPKHHYHHHDNVRKSGAGYNQNQKSWVDNTIAEVKKIKSFMDEGKEVLGAINMGSSSGVGKVKSEHNLSSLQNSF